MVKKDLDKLEREFWLGNRKPAKLWSEIGRQLRSRGWAWPGFLRILKISSGDIVLYEMREITWADLGQRILEFTRLYGAPRP